jgi:tetratricopeptide (TPR) repeat protein
MLALGNAHVALGDAETAIARYRLALEETPDERTLQRALGATLVSTGDADGAVAVLEGPAAAEPVDAFANTELAKAFIATNRPADAAAAAERAASVDATALSLAARAHLLAGDPAAAVDAVDRLVARRPDDPGSWREQGAILGALGRYRDAADVFTAGLERFPGDAALYRGRSMAHVRLNTLDAAAEDATRAASLAPRWLEPRFLLGTIEEARGDGSAATAAYREALSLDADHWPTLIRLSALSLSAGNAGAAKSLAERAVAASGEQAAALEALEAANAAMPAGQP